MRYASKCLPVMCLLLHIVTCRYPVGGDSLSVTKGIVSRLALVRYRCVLGCMCVFMVEVRAGMKWGWVVAQLPMLYNTAGLYCTWVWEVAYLKIPLKYD